jgi:hypothetical protein
VRPRLFKSSRRGERPGERIVREDILALLQFLLASRTAKPASSPRVAR